MEFVFSDFINPVSSNTGMLEPEPESASHRVTTEKDSSKTVGRSARWKLYGQECVEGKDYHWPNYWENCWCVTVFVDKLLGKLVKLNAFCESTRWQIIVEIVKLKHF